MLLTFIIIYLCVRDIIGYVEPDLDEKKHQSDHQEPIFEVPKLNDPHFQDLNPYSPKFRETDIYEPDFNSPSVIERGVDLEHDPNDKMLGPEEPPLPENWTDTMANVTTCEQLLGNVTFDPFKVIDIDWKIWYYWNHEFEESYNIKFSIPSKVLVDRYRVELDEEMKPPVNWSDAILFMETTIDFSALFLKTPNEGQFRVIPSLAFEYAHLPELIFGLKVIEPEGYLAMMNCKYRLCYALAPVDKMPYYLKYDEEAKKIGFVGRFGRSHIAISPPPPEFEVEMDEQDEIHDDDEEDRHLEWQRQFEDSMDAVLL